jgi:hypothetical protein
MRHRARLFLLPSPPASVHSLDPPLNTALTHIPLALLSQHQPPHTSSSHPASSLSIRPLSLSFSPPTLASTRPYRIVVGRTIARAPNRVACLSARTTTCPDPSHTSFDHGDPACHRIVKPRSTPLLVWQPQLKLEQYCGRALQGREKDRGRVVRCDF